MNWKPGDRALCITPGSNICGLEVTVMSGLQFDLAIEIDGSVGFSSHHIVEPDICERDFIWVASPRHLKPIYDGNQKSSWEDCAWTPDEVVTLV